MQQQKSYNSSEVARLYGVNNTTVQRAIQRGELLATRYRDRSPFSIERAEALRWGAEQGWRIHGENGELIDPATGEIVEAPAPLVIEPGVEVPAEPTPIDAAMAARARLAGVAPRVETNVSRVILPSADAGLLEACRRLVALPDSPQLWQALRAVLGVEVAG